MNAVEQANKLSNTATVIVSYSSAPPQIIASCSPYLTASYPKPMDWLAVVQAVFDERMRPVIPNILEILTAVV